MPALRSQGARWEVESWALCFPHAGSPEATCPCLIFWPGSWALSLQSSTQEIGEELINGVIYSISLRKVQLHQGATKGQRWLGVSVERRPGW